VIPLFGRPQRDDERPGKPLRERFLAEALFLKRFGALESYLAFYVKEARLKFQRRAGEVSEGEFAARAARVCGLEARDVEFAVSPGRGRRGAGVRDFIRKRETLLAILERLG
jgi:hypothetical protein